MDFQHTMITVENVSELDALAGSKPIVFCLENKRFHVWDEVGFTEFLNTDDVNAADSAVQAAAVQRANHTGTQPASTISDFNSAALVAAPPVSMDAFGYATGAGGTVTQNTNKSTAVTLNKLCGQITMHGAALAAGAIVSFTLNNSTILANDLIVANHVAGGTFGPYLINARASGAGTAVITVRNTSAGSLSEAIQIRFAVIRGVVS